MRIPESTLATLAQERGLKETTLRQAGIRRHEQHPFDGWWEIPYPHRTGVWKRRYKNPAAGARPKYKDEPGAKFHLYNPLCLGPNEEEVWFTEGEFDTLCLIEAGVPAIGIHGVSNIGDGEEGMLPTERGFRKDWLLLFEDSLCVVAFDQDEAAVEPQRRLAAALKGEQFDDWDTKYTDFNDWYRGDPEGFRARIAGYRDRTRRLYGLA